MHGPSGENLPRDAKICPKKKKVSLFDISLIITTILNILSGYFVFYVQADFTLKIFVLFVSVISWVLLIVEEKISESVII